MVVNTSNRSTWEAFETKGLGDPGQSVLHSEILHKKHTNK